MEKIVDCAKVNPVSGRGHVVGGEIEEKLLKNVAEHAKEHGLVEVVLELIGTVKANIQDE